MAKRFVFLEITDPEVAALISRLRELAMASRPRSSVHITIRGPYSRVIPLRQIAHYGYVLRSQPLLVDGVGKFQSDGRHVVYLRVKHPDLRRIWWKPDFPIERFGFNPHLTIYEGTNPDRADLVEQFLSRERIKLLVQDFHVTPYVSDHADFFAVQAQSEIQFLSLVNRGVIRADILARFARALGPTDRSVVRRLAAN